MRFFVLSRGDHISNQIKEELIHELTNKQCAFDELQPQIVISVGGDGTMLDAFHQFKHMLSKTAFVGIHTGRLGFYADWRPEETEELVNHIAHSPLQIVEYPLLEVTLSFRECEEKDTFLALNECTIKSNTGSVVMEIMLNGDHFETFRGDGLCLSTPTGSTAYNKSLGGAIVHPSISAIQMTEMASINNRVYRTIGSSMIIPKHHACMLKPIRNAEHVLTIDHLTISFKNIASIHFQAAQENVRFARYRSFPFWKRVNESFIE